jgi:hypothetical protein
MGGGYSIYSTAYPGTPTPAPPPPPVQFAQLDAVAPRQLIAC